MMKLANLSNFIMFKDPYCDVTDIHAFFINLTFEHYMSIYFSIINCGGLMNFN